MNTHILMQSFALHQPNSIEGAVRLLAAHGSEARVLAGGTDLLVNMKMERVRSPQIVYIGRIRSLKGLADDAGLSMGALATFFDLQQSGSVRRLYPALHEAAHSISGTQIKIMGSIGGNLVNASPASDSAPALLLYDAVVELVSEQGKRQVALHEFFVGPGETVREQTELLTRITLPPPEPSEGSAFLKLGRVGADIAKVSAAVRLVRDAGKITRCRIALGSVAPRPVRALTVEAGVAGERFSAALAQEAGQAAAAAIEPISDVRSSAEYRRQVTAVLVRDALLKAWARADANAR